MATQTTAQSATPKTPKAKAAPVAIGVRVQDQLAKAVLGKKITKDELTQIQSKVEKLIAFMDV